MGEVPRAPIECRAHEKLFGNHFANGSRLAIGKTLAISCRAIRMPVSRATQAFHRSVQKHFAVATQAPFQRRVRFSLKQSKRNHHASAAQALHAPRAPYESLAKAP